MLRLCKDCGRPDCSTRGIVMGCEFTLSCGSTKEERKEEPMKYMIELESIPGTDLFKAKGANTLVFDRKGIENILTPLAENAKKKVMRFKNINTGEELIEAYNHFQKEACNHICKDCKYKKPTRNCVINYLLEEVDV